MKRLLLPALALLAVVAFAAVGYSDVLGPCGTPDAQKPAAELTKDGTGNAGGVRPIPLPGQQAPNFELDALIGDEVRKIKLSDYDGKWRVVCFYPADFTFV
jgi:hypothetical protein